MPRDYCGERSRGGGNLLPILVFQYSFVALDFGIFRGAHLYEHIEHQEFRNDRVLVRDDQGSNDCGLLNFGNGAGYGVRVPANRNGELHGAWM